MNMLVSLWPARQTAGLVRAGCGLLPFGGVFPELFEELKAGSSKWESYFLPLPRGG